jgi:hypothetical protein
LFLSAFIQLLEISAQVRRHRYHRRRSKSPFPYRELYLNVGQSFSDYLLTLNFSLTFSQAGSAQNAWRAFNYYPLSHMLLKWAVTAGYLCMVRVSASSGRITHPSGGHH